VQHVKWTKHVIKLSPSLVTIQHCITDIKIGQEHCDMTTALCVALHLLGTVCRNFTFDAVHLEGAQRLARIARESGVERFIHMSHLNAQPNPPSKYVKGGSKYLKAKVRFLLVVINYVHCKGLE